MCWTKSWFYADAAGDEQVAGEMLMADDDGSGAMLPSLRLVGRDKTHAAARILKRPYKACPFMNEVYDKMLLNKDSVASLICNATGTIGAWLAENCEKSTSGLVKPGRRGAPTLCFRRHRHNSMHGPGVRIIIYFDAMLATASMIASNRRGSDEGKSALAWLRWLDCEKALQFSMLIDAADEVMGLLRFHDREACDPSEIAHAISCFVNNIMRLFHQRDVLKCGMTATMLLHLSVPHTMVLDGVATTIGSARGVAPEVIGKCIRRMEHWVRLALEVVQAEWPGFEIVQAMTIFNVSRVCHESIQSFSMIHKLEYLNASSACRVSCRSKPTSWRSNTESFNRLQSIAWTVNHAKVCSPLCTHGAQPSNVAKPRVVDPRDGLSTF